MKDATTPCPACERPVPIGALRCPSCASEADCKSAFVHFTRPDGTGGVIDQQTAQFFRSGAGFPKQSDLDVLFKSARDVTVRKLVPIDERRFEYQPQFKVDDASRLESLRQSLVIRDVETAAHVMAIGDWILELETDEGLQTIELIGLYALRWTSMWKGDASYEDPHRIALWFAEQGVAELLEQLTRQKLDESETVRQHLEWLATWEPAVIPEIRQYMEVLGEHWAANTHELRDHLVHELVGMYGSNESVILRLLAWYGHANGPWNQYATMELAPECLLRGFSTAEIVNTVEMASRVRGLTRQELEGTSRLIATHWFSKADRKRREQIANAFSASLVSEQLLEHVISESDANKIGHLKRLLKRKPHEA